MSDLIDQILTPEVRMVLYLMVMCIVMVYILSIVYVTRDAQRRGAEPWWIWALVSVVPIVGLLTYVILRPSSYLIDRKSRISILHFVSISFRTTASAPSAQALSIAILLCVLYATRKCVTCARPVIARSMPTGRFARIAGRVFSRKLRTRTFSS